MNIIYCDYPKRWQTGFQDPATPVMEGIIDLHHTIFFFLIIILITVLFLFNQVFEFFLLPILPKINEVHYYLRTILFKKDNYIPFLFISKVNSFKNHYLEFLIKFYDIKKHLKFNYDTLIEIVWTIVPSIILIFIAIPSFILLYSIDEIVYPQLTIKVIGHQWFWSYESYDFFNIKSNKILYQYDSYMINTEDLNDGKLRLLDVDLPLYLPIRTHIRVLITSSDVLHSWAVPSLGVKMDAVPGRLNQISLFLKRKGTFYGQCSEICGINHGFMPIVVKGISIDNYIKYFL
jgi:cytochrome c oxidase subunit 2